MFEVPSGSSGSRRWIAVSLLAHVAIAAAVMYAWPEFVLTTSVSMTTLSPARASGKTSYVMFSGLTTPAKLPPVVRRPKLSIRHHPAPVPPHPDTSEHELHALAAVVGPILRGTAVLYSGIHDIKVALPQVAPTPNIKRSEIPPGSQGDIVLNIVIDKSGKVVRATVQQGFANLETRVVSTVLNWHFSPATYDGVPVASIQEIHFHYPDSAISDSPASV
jgi:periplasmic protein TonB